MRTREFVPGVRTAALVLVAASLASPGAGAVEPSDQGLRHGIGLAYSGSTVSFDVDRGDSGDPTFSGIGVFGKFGITERWAVFASYRDLDGTDLDPGEDVSFTLADVHAAFTFAVTLRSRWHVKAGIASLDFDSKRPIEGSTSDSAISPSIGLGFEWGGRRVRLFVDFGVSFPEVELIPGESESLVVGNTNTGLIFKF